MTFRSYTSLLSLSLAKMDLLSFFLSEIIPRRDVYQRDKPKNTSTFVFFYK